MATMKRTNAMLSTREAWEIAENATMRLPHRGASMVVLVERGTVLVTQEGNPEDHVLAAGDMVVLAGGGLAVAWAFTDAAITVLDSTLAAPRPQRRARWDGRSRAPLGQAMAGVM